MTVPGERRADDSRLPLGDPSLPPDTISVTQLSGRIAAALAHHLPSSTWLAGEVLLAKRPGTGKHLYFELADRPEPGAQPTAKMQIMVRASDLRRFQAKLGGAGLALTDGLEIRIRGRVQLWQGSGGLTFCADDIDAEWSLGRIAADRDALLRVLDSEGLLAKQAGLRIDAVPLRVALITSGTSAAYADFTRHIRDSGIAFEVCSVDVRVQGADAPSEIARALRGVAAPLYRSWEPDVVVLIRGGGSRSDLATFDTEEVARAIAACPLPVLVGIGHEIDTSVADKVAHVSAKTPTDCAVVLVERVMRTTAHAEQLYTRAAVAATARLERAFDALDSRAARSSTAADASLGRQATHLDNLAGRAMRAATVSIDRAGRQLDTHADRIRTHSAAALRAADSRLDTAAAIIRSCDPASVLARGFSITRDATGKAVTDAATVTAGDVLTTTLATGTVASLAQHPIKEPTDD